MRRVLCVLLISILFLSTITIPIYAQNEIKVTLNGKIIEFPDMKPVIVNGRTLVPVRAIFEKMGLEVGWDGETRTVIGKKDGIEIKLPIDNKHATKNKEEMELDVPASIIEGRTMVPVRFIADSVGAKIDWDGQTRTVVIVYIDENNKESGNVLYNEVIKLGDNVFATINYNYELATIGAATGSNFQHKGYLCFNTETSERIKEYFSQYTDLDSAKNIYDICMPESQNENRYINPSTVHLLDVYPDSLELDLNSRLMNTTSKIKNPEDLNIVVRNFERETQATNFFKENNDMYRSIFEKYKKDYNFDHISRIGDFFGFGITDEKFILYLTLNKNGGTSTDAKRNDGTRVNINFINIMFDDDDHILMNILYHEAIHNFMRVVMDKYNDEINNYEKYSSVLNERNWDDFRGSLNETVTRAISAIMMEEYHDKQEGAEKLIINEIKNGWINTDEFYKFIKNKYVSNRDKYKTFEEFFPEILEYLKELHDNPPKDIKYGIDLSSVNKLYLFGSSEFCRNVPIFGPTVGENASISHFEDSYLEGKNLIVISGDTEYSRLPIKIRQNISENEYKDLKTKGYITFKIGDAIILILD